MSGGLGSFPRPSDEVRKGALEHPGPSWTDWFYSTFLQVWVPLGFLIVDSWIVAGFFADDLPVLIVPALIPALVVEYYAWAYLWIRPAGDRSYSTRGFERTWLRPVEYGRWTVEGRRIRAGLPATDEPPRGPDPSEFF